MIYPSMSNGALMLTACYKDLELLYQIEKKLLVKYGNILCKVLYSSNIQKQKLFSEKNIVALQHISKDNPNLFRSIVGTTEFLKIFVQWWKTVNVKSVFEGKRFCILISKEVSFHLKEECLCYCTFLNKLESVVLTSCKILLNNYVKSLNDEQLAKRKKSSDQIMLAPLPSPLRFL